MGIQAENHAVDALIRHSHRSSHDDQIHLALTGPQVTDLTFHHLSAPGYREIAMEMSKATISQCKVTDEGLEILADQIRALPMMMFSEFCVYSSDVTEEGILKVVRAVPYLSRLEVTDIKLSDQFVDKLPELPALADLSFIYTDISDTTIEKLSRFKKLRNLSVEEHLVSQEAVDCLVEEMKPPWYTRLWNSGLSVIRSSTTANPDLW